MNENLPPLPEKRGINQYEISPWEAVGLGLIVLLCGQGIGGIVAAPTAFIPKLNHVLLPLSFFVGFAASIAAIMLLKKLNFKDLMTFLKPFPNFLIFILIILLYFSTMPLAEYLTQIVPTEGVKWLEWLYDLVEGIFTMIMEYKIAAFITVCILAPILEEFVFRGLILRGMLNAKINPWYCILLTSFLFGVAHLNPWQFFGAGILGIIFAFVYWRTRSLWVCIFLHALNNTLAFVLTINSEGQEEMIFDFNPFLILGGIILMFIFGYLIYHLTRNAAHLRNTQPAQIV